MSDQELINALNGAAAWRLEFQPDNPLGLVLQKTATRFQELLAEVETVGRNRDYWKREAEHMAAIIERLRLLLDDKEYIQAKADYNRGHLSHFGYLGARERKAFKGE